VVHKIYFDGGTALNAICIYDDSRKEYIIQKAPPGLTNNTLEYMALRKAAYLAVARYQESTFEFCGDSELIVKQMNGEYTVKKKHLLDIKLEVDNVLRSSISKLTWVPRDNNRAGVILELALLITRKHMYD